MAYTPLRISTIKPEKLVNFDLYIFYRETYIKYLENGNSLSDSKYKKLKKQKIAKFFITEEDEGKYQLFLDQILQETLNSETATVDEKVSVIEGAAENAVETMQRDPESEASYNIAKKAASGLRQLVLENQEALKMVFGKEVDPQDALIKHCLNVSVLSTKMAKVMGCSDEEIDEMAIAGLIHDIGFTKLDPKVKDLFNVPSNDMSFEDKKLYYSHCTDGLKLIAEKPFVTKSIMDLISNHEETQSGTGPNKLKKLTKLQSILSIVNRYDKKVITQKMTPREAIKSMMIDDLGNYDLDLIQTFKKVLTDDKLI